MVAKGFLAAAAIIICCSTTLQGKDPEEKCASGDCPAACSDQEKCRVEKTVCDDAKCDDKEECCEKECDKEQIALKKCSTEKCRAEKCTAEKCSAEKCTFSACAGGACDSLRCAPDGSAKSACAAEGTCAKSKCSTETCAASNGAEGQCGAESCPVAACAGQVCDALKCALQSCTTASDDDCCLDAVCAMGACGTTQCATLQGSGQDCPAGECSGAHCSDEVCDGLKCAVGICLTSSGGQLTFTATKSFAGEPASVTCSTEACTEETCSTEKCGTEKCAASTCSTSKCATEKCSQETCATSKYSTEICESGKVDVSACVGEDCAASGSELETKLVEFNRLQREIADLRRQSGTPEQLSVNVKVVEVNMTKCRSLGFAFDADSPTAASDLNDAIKRTPGILAAFEKNNLARVLANPTLMVASGRPASFHSGGEFPVIDAEGGTEFKQFGTKVDVLATSLGDRKVQLEIRPEFSQVQGTCGPAPCPALTARRWDSSFVTTLGASLVLSSASEHRVVSKVVADNRKSPTEKKVVEEVEEVQCFAVVTVTAIDEPLGSTPAVRHAAYENGSLSDYEEKLVSGVKEPDFVTKVYPVPDLQVWKVRPQGVQFDADLLIAHVKAMVDPQSWRGAACASPADAAHADGAIQPFERNGSLVICQTEANHERIAKLFQQMRTEGQRKDEERKLRDGGVTPASAEAPVEQESKCSKGECSEEKCPGKECSKSEVSLESESADECPGKCADGACQGECPETASCPCIGGACTR